jgi:hypothetical protein
LIGGLDGAAAGQGEHREVGFHVLVVADPRVGVGFGCSPVEFGQGGGGCGGGVGFVRPDGCVDVQVGGWLLMGGFSVFGMLGDGVEEQRQPPHPLLALILDLLTFMLDRSRGSGEELVEGVAAVEVLLDYGN